MRHTKSLIAALFVGLAGGGLLYAQPADGELPDVTASGETQADLTPREMVTESERLIEEMGSMHLRVLELQGAARKAKDVIKLNCVNEKLLAVKQLLNIADDAKLELTESISGGDKAGQVHQYGQVKLAHERTTAERDGAQGCIGEEIIFIGPTNVEVDGPPMPDDPTDDGEDPFGITSDSLFERAATATPFGR